MSEDQYSDLSRPDNSFKSDSNCWKLYSNQLFIENLENEVEFHKINTGFEVNISSLSEEFITFSKQLFNQILVLILKYLPINENIFKTFQLINPNNRAINNSKFLFREYLIKKFVRCYEYENHKVVLKQFEDFANLTLLNYK